MGEGGEEVRDRVRGKARGVEEQTQRQVHAHRNRLLHVVVAICSHHTPVDLRTTLEYHILLVVMLLM